MAKTIFITGASSGMGRDMTMFFAEKGWNVASTMRNPSRDGADLAAMNGVKTYALDVTDLASISAALESAITDFGKLDVLVNNAGVGNLGPMEGSSEAQVAQQVDVNFLGPIHVTRAALPQMRAQGGGIIINITSIGGRITMPHNALYHGMKWGMEGLTEALAYELNPFGIKVKAVAPGGVKTSFVQSIARAETTLDPEYDRQVTAFTTTAMARTDGWSEPRVVSEAVWEAATDGTDKIRYLAGEDAKQMAAGRSQMDDEAWVAMMKTNFGI